ncbi:MAG: hypothetical protein U9O87_09025 [Verrucomicrobiota bacterium]|nr:hypothetical protein [Verrucomicrobiota bacterium]
MNKIYKYYLFPILLILFVWLAYYPICSNDFINFDDQVYVTLNPNVNTGLTKANIEWAFKTNKCSNWHPLTWLSHMTDCQLFGLNAGKHHLVSLTIHTLVVLLLYIFLCIATSAFIPAFIVAILFAIHPVHTESVIWISERKDLLCALFFYLSLISYSLYVKNKNFSKRFYSIALLSFILGLLSKPMIVSLPIILFLLDFWPFERINFLAFTQKTHFIEKTVEFIKNNRKLIYEKIPFIILSAISCIVTFLVQRSGGAVRSLKAMPLFVRFPSSLVAYATYLKKLLFPQEFAIFYPHSSYNISFGKILISFIVLVAITILILWKRKKQKQLLTGWLWFIVMLIPVIGIIQVGGQALADRYMYLPAVGIYLILTWIIKEYIPQLSTNKNFPPPFSVYYNYAFYPENKTTGLFMEKF